MRVLFDHELDVIAGGALDPGGGGGGGGGGGNPPPPQPPPTSPPATFKVNGGTGVFNGQAGQFSQQVGYQSGILTATMSNDAVGHVTESLSGHVTVGDLSVVAGYNSNGTATGSVTAQLGAEAFSFNASGATGYTHAFSNGVTMNASITNGSNWGFSFGASNGSLSCNLGASSSSSTGYLMSAGCLYNFGQ
jgi:hypothetical protein